MSSVERTLENGTVKRRTTLWIEKNKLAEFQALASGAFVQKAQAIEEAMDLWIERYKEEKRKT